MKLLSIVMLLLSLFNYSNKKESNYIANSFIVMEQRTGFVLEGINYYKTQSVASISKIMTGIIAIENLDLNKKVLVDNCIDKAYGSAVYLKKGTWITNRDLIYGLMLRSGNDCALMIAKSVSNDLDNFINLMNKKAKELKMNNTTFVNPHGLDEEDGGNISCAYDMAILQSYALNNKMYREITITKTYKSEGYGVWINKNKLLNQYEYTISGKTGYTRKAKRTLVTSASKDDLDLTVVTLNCGGDFAYHKELYQKHFDKYGVKKVICKGELKVLDYKTLINEDVYYFDTKKNLENLQLYIDIDKKTNIGKIYVIVNNDKEVLLETSFEKIEKKESFWTFVFKKWKEMFF